MVVKDYLAQAKALLASGEYTDGCTTPFKTYIHRWLKKSYLLCAAHDFGGKGLIKGVAAGWENNLMVWLAHMANANPVYWVWGTIVAVWTLPWVVWRHNFGIKFIESSLLFGALQFMGIVLYFLMKYKNEIVAITG